MKTLWAGFLAAVALAGTAGAEESAAQAFANQKTFFDVHALASSSRSFRVAYITGVADTMSVYTTVLHAYSEALKEPPKHPVCIPDGTTAGQLTDAVDKYLVKNQGKLGGDAAIATMNALMDAFPCAKEAGHEKDAKP